MSKEAHQRNSDKINRFKEAARELGCDEDEAAFDEKLKKLAHPPEKNVKLKNPPESK